MALTRVARIRAGRNLLPSVGDLTLSGYTAQKYLNVNAWIILGRATREISVVILDAASLFHKSGYLQKSL